MRSMKVESPQFWWKHARWPLAFFIVAAIVFAATNLDFEIANTLFFDVANLQWLGAGNFWINDVIHTGGRWAVRGLVGIALAVWIASSWAPALQRLRRPAAYFVTAVVLTVGIVGLLKTITNVDCPWDLQSFGGRFPYVDLFASRPASLRRAMCFPAAHASSGYALMALYFLIYERSRRLAVLGLTTGVFVGLIFGIAQQARGAHFASHDLWSAFIAWIVPLTVYTFAFRARLHPHTE